ncbi:GNAT family N-acetyltransferase [Pseudalkalibacillus sp. Hm43]|uniref:GNAT family N-acetyltransferase n=1 Tax=Pseudalkalibacillus sp. Hm43 TaxID=3450742 RepID=UPI003F431A7E
MIVLERMSNCRLTDVLDAWNHGFKGYFTDMTMTMDRFLQRMVHEGFSADDSIIAFVDGVPAGVVLNGFREIDGKMIGYNGGTGVAPEFRRSGVGKKMMEEVFRIYEEKRADFATLEAIRDNEAAIRLYESLGYEIHDHVEFLQQQGVIEETRSTIQEGWQFERTAPEMVRHFPFYDVNGPWQTQWQSVHNGRALIVSDASGEIGYALYRTLYDEHGTVSTIVLHQFGMKKDVEAPDTLMNAILKEVLQPELDCKRLVINLSSEKKEQYEAIKRFGFSTMIEQVCMEKPMKERKSSLSNATSIGEI